MRQRGIDRRGQTVVLPELAEPEFPLPTSDIRQDLVEFDKLFGLPAAKLQVNTSMAPLASPWLANGEELLRLIGRGETNAEIASSLYIGEGTVKTHIGHLFTKLGLRDRAAAVVFAFDHGLVVPTGYLTLVVAGNPPGARRLIPEGPLASRT